MALTDLFTDIADSIRQKDGTTEQILAVDFADRILGIPSGGLSVSVDVGEVILATDKNVNYNPQYDANVIEISHNLGKVPAFVYLGYDYGNEELDYIPANALQVCYGWIYNNDFIQSLKNENGKWELYGLGCGSTRTYNSTGGNSTSFRSLDYIETGYNEYNRHTFFADENTFCVGNTDANTVPVKAGYKYKYIAIAID